MDASFFRTLSSTREEYLRRIEWEKQKPRICLLPVRNAYTGEILGYQCLQRMWDGTLKYVGQLSTGVPFRIPESEKS